MDEPKGQTARPCLPRARCRKWRTCEVCARIRQAKIADAAERLATIAPKLNWACIQPDHAGAAALAAARAEFLAAADPPGAIWTVEQSPTTGRLHCNILTPTEPDRPLRKSRLWIAPVAGDVRHVAAYIAKRDQMPAKAEYGGRLYGTAGPLWQWLTDRRQETLTLAAATQYDLDKDAIQAQPSGIERYAQEVRAPTAEECRAIAERRLPDLLRLRQRLR